MLTTSLNRECPRETLRAGRDGRQNPWPLVPRTGRQNPARRAEESCRVAVLLAADAFGIAPEKIVAAARGTAEAARTRQAAMYIAHVALGIPLIAVGCCFGRDHSTVAHGCRQVEDRRDDTAFDAVVAELALAARIALCLDREITA
jgi:hypothetical protein